MFATELYDIEAEEALEASPRTHLRLLPSSPPPSSYARVWRSILLEAAFVMALVVGLMGLWLQSASGTRHANQVPAASHVYVVKPGDTLYSIAVRFSGGSDLNAYLYQLEGEIGGSASIYPGERIQLP